MLKPVRIVLETLFFVLITLLFLDKTAVLHNWFGWLPKIQLLPAILAVNFTVVILIILLTLVFGRIYCSVICPMGALQDSISWLSRKRKGKKLSFGWKKPHNALRYTIMALFVILMAAGLNSIAYLIAPYSAFGRIASSVLSPSGSIAVIIIAAVTLVVIFVFAWVGGRTWCNTVCPVGSLLSLISRFSLLRPVIDTSKCVNCGICGKKCKASCIDTQNHTVDMSRCIACMDCIDNCKSKAISFKMKKSASETSQTDGSRRNFLSASAIVLASATVDAAAQHVDGGLTKLEPKHNPRETAPKPAGSRSIKNFSDKCIACQLCVSECPEKVLRPSTKFSSFMQPEMSFDNGFCRPECNRCSQVCPAGAIKPVTVEEKSSIQIGHAVVVPRNCIGCGNCERHCPSGAIIMVKGIASVDAEKCIGCGSCEFHCPVRPDVAIYVEGHSIQKEI